MTKLFVYQKKKKFTLLYVNEFDDENTWCCGSRTNLRVMMLIQTQNDTDTDTESANDDDHHGDVDDATFKKDFPYTIRGVQFAKFNQFHKDSTFRGRHIILGGLNHSENVFHELILTDFGDDLIFKSFDSDYNKKNGQIARGAGGYHSYLVQNNKYLAVIQKSLEYNVYDIENDKWLLPDRSSQDRIEIESPSVDGPRSALIGDDIIAFSGDTQINFYYIANDHITKPVLINKYNMKLNKTFEYYYHGICCIDYEKKINKDDKIDYRFKLVLFGGRMKFLQSFVEFDVTLNVTSTKKLSQLQLKGGDGSINTGTDSEDGSVIDCKLKVKEKIITSDEIICSKELTALQSNLNVWMSFGHGCIINSKNESIIIVVGGHEGGAWKSHLSIYLFNCTSKTLDVKNVKCLYINIAKKKHKKILFPHVFLNIIVYICRYCHLIVDIIHPQVYKRVKMVTTTT